MRKMFLFVMVMAAVFAASGCDNGNYNDNSNQPTVKSFAVTVDYSRSLAEMIAAGKYDWVDSDITEKIFPVQKPPAGLPTKVDLQLELVNFNETISSDNVIAELKKRGLCPATLPELLAFHEKYPEEQRNHAILALGSVWQRWGGREVVGYGSRRRSLFLSSFEMDSSAYYSFLAVRESR